MSTRVPVAVVPILLAVAPAAADLDAAPVSPSVAERLDSPQSLSRLAGACDGLGRVVGPVQPSTETDEWSAPASYYAGVTGTGSAVLGQLRTAMTTGHIQRRYGDFRQSAAIHDADPDRPGNILLSYNVASVRAQWDSGSTWNREHVWPQSRQPGSASNSSRGNLGDPHALRPCNPNVNGSRGNKPFGFGDTTGGFRSLGAYYFPGDIDKGPTARTLFYSTGRYGLQLVDGFPSGNQMGDLGSLVEWHYLEKPETFERRRNHTIFSQAFNPSYYTNNRNAFVDMPGSVWAAFRDNFNDGQLWVGDAPDADGGSSAQLCQSVIVGTQPNGIEIDIHRAGVDGVYYAVIPSGDAITDQPLTNGFTDTFGIDDGAPRPIVVSIDPAAITAAGVYTGDIVIDNLDMTDGLGAGFGALDADDTITVTATAFDPATGSFDPVSVVDSTTVTLGPGSSVSLPLHALEATPGFTAGASVSLISAQGDFDAFDLTLPAGVIEPGTSSDVLFTLASTPGMPASATYDLLVSDDPSIAGADGRVVLSVVVNAGLSSCPADVAPPFGVLDLDDIDTFVIGYVAGNPLADVAPPTGVLDLDDIDLFVQTYFAGCP